VSVLLQTWSYLVRYEALKWRPPFTHLGDSTPSCGVIPHCFTIPKFFFHHLFHLSISSPFYLKHVLTFASLNFNSVLSLFLYCLFNSAPYFSSFSLYTCVFLLPLRNELSHLLNHLVKLMSSGDFP